MKIGDRIQDRIDQAIRVYDKLLLVLSRQSIGSNWVEREVQQEFRKEGESPDRAAKPLVLFPIRLDNTIEQARSQWARRIYETRHVGDFSRWKDHDQYQAALARLLRDLQAGGSAPDG
jgi:hypothetical protein